MKTHPAHATLSEPAKIMGYSVVYTGELVKLRTGKPFSDVLQEKSCLTAADLPVDSDLSVEEIICRVGYKNQTFFRNIFRATYGKAPLAYRNSMRGVKYDK